MMEKSLWLNSDKYQDIHNNLLGSALSLMVFPSEYNHQLESPKFWCNCSNAIHKFQNMELDNPLLGQRSSSFDFRLVFHSTIVHILNESFESIHQQK
jgi:hypothetical protein